MSNIVNRSAEQAKSNVKARPTPRTNAKARASAVYNNLQILAEQEEAPKPLTSANIKKILVPNSYKQYTYTVRLWKT
jgi:hypothetical protein